jgi:multidrug resistance protein MdtO
MWLVFDRLWSRNALDEMVVLFARNLEMFAELSEQLLLEDRNQAIARARQLRDQITAGFQAVTAQADAVLFEFGPDRHDKLKIRENIRRWQPSVRTLLLVLITYAQYRWQRPLKDLAPAIAEAHIAFDKDFAATMRALASEVTGKAPEPVPDIHAVAENLQRQISQYFEDQNLPVSIVGADVIRLVGSLTSILTPLHEDIHETFANAGNSLEGRAPAQQTAEA